MLSICIRRGSYYLEDGESAASRSRRCCVIASAVIVALLVVGGALTVGIWLSVNANESGTHIV